MANGPLDQPGFDLAGRVGPDARRGRRHASGWRSPGTSPSPAAASTRSRPTTARCSPRRRAGIDVLALVVRSPSWAAVQPGQPFSAAEGPRGLRGVHDGDGRPLRARTARCGPSTPRCPGARCAPGRSGTSRTSPTTGRCSRSCGATRGCSSSAYAAVKGADKGATVVMAGLANFSWRDLARLYAKGGRKLRFDVAAVHPFSGRPSNSVKIVRLNRDVLNRNGASKRPIWLTELTWSSAKGRKTPITKDWETTEAGQAQRLREAFGLFVPGAQVAPPRAHLLVHVDHGRPRLAQLVRLLGPAHPAPRRQRRGQARGARVPRGRQAVPASCRTQGRCPADPTPGLPAGRLDSIETHRDPPHPPCRGIRWGS